MSGRVNHPGQFSARTTSLFWSVFNERQQQQADFSAQLALRLEGTLADLQRLQGRQLEQLTLDLEKQLETVRRGRFEQRSRDIHRVFDDYRRWVEDTLTTEPQPWIQVLAAVCNPCSSSAVVGA